MGRTCASLLIAALISLGGCSTAAGGNPTFDGEGATLRSGSAFGLTVGMDSDDAHRQLVAENRFRFRSMVCVSPGTEDTPDPKRPGKAAQYCGDDTQREMWWADQPGPVTILDLYIRDHKVIRLKWWRAPQLVE